MTDFDIGFIKFAQPNYDELGRYTLIIVGVILAVYVLVSLFKKTETISNQPNIIEIPTVQPKASRSKSPAPKSPRSRRTPAKKTVGDGPWPEYKSPVQGTVLTKDGRKSTRKNKGINSRSD